MLRNIANVVHDLESLILNHKTQLEILTQEKITTKDKEDLLKSIFEESLILEDYLNLLRDEAKFYSLQKIDLPRPF